MTAEQTDPLVPPSWQAVDRLLDEIVPKSSQPSSRWLLDEAITALVIEAETIAVKRHGQVILEAVFGDQFQAMSELCEDR
jgi:hypothetical protein